MRERGGGQRERSTERCIAADIRGGRREGCGVRRFVESDVEVLGFERVRRGGG